MKWTLLIPVFALSALALPHDYSKRDDDDRFDSDNDGDDSDYNNYSQSVISSLQDNGLTTLASALSLLKGMPEGRTFFNRLTDDERTVFAPSNDAFTNAGFPNDFSSSSSDIDTQSLLDLLLYHITDDSIVDGDDRIKYSPDHSVFDTLLTGATGGENITYSNDTAVPLIMSRPDRGSSDFVIMRTGNNVTVTGQPTTVGDLSIYTIDQLIPLPRSLTEVLDYANLTQLSSVLSDAGLLESLNSSDYGVTVFAPTNNAFEAISDALGGLSNETIALILQNHVVNGTVAFSDSISDEIEEDRENDNDDDDDDDDDDDELEPLAGPAFTFMANSTGRYLTSGNATAQILQQDYVFDGGVVHIIDSVLVNENPQVNTPATMKSDNRDDNDRDGDDGDNNNDEENDGDGQDRDNEEDSNDRDSSDRDAGREDDSNDGDEDEQDGSDRESDQDNNDNDNDESDNEDSEENDNESD